MGGDVYLLKYILHDWDDEHSLNILQNCRKAMKPTSKLLIVEAVIPETQAYHLGTFDDLEMLILLGGQHRTKGEHERLLLKSGFVLGKETKTESYLSILEAIPDQNTNFF